MAARTGARTGLSPPAQASDSSALEHSATEGTDDVSHRDFYSQVFLLHAYSDFYLLFLPRHQTYFFSPVGEQLTFRIAVLCAGPGGWLPPGKFSVDCAARHRRTAGQSATCSSLERSGAPRQALREVMAAACDSLHVDMAKDI